MRKRSGERLISCRITRAWGGSRSRSIDSALPVVIHRQRRVIAELDVAENRSRFCHRGHARRRDLIIDPPPDVFRVSLSTITPPRVLLRPLIERAEDVE